MFRIFGTASGQDFAGFVLEFGAGEFPETWKVIVQSARPVTQGLLAEWKTASLASAAHALRLTVRNTKGETLSDRMVFKVQDHRPDLVIDDLSAIVSGTQFSITGTVENRGKLSTRRPVGVNFYLSETQTQDSSSVPLGESQAPVIQVNSHATLETRLDIPSRIKDGDYFLLARVDPKDQIVEVSEENNVVSSLSRIVLAPDLLVSELQSGLAKEGGQIGISGKVKNQGNRPVTQSFALSFFLSSDGSIDTRDLKLGRQTLEGLGIGTTASFTVNAPLQDGLEPGSYFVLAQIDPDGKVYERDKSNNTYWGSSLTLGPDLTIVSLSTTLSKDGRQIIIQDRVKNQGRYPAKQPFKIAYALASDGSPEQQLGSREVPVLPAGESTSASTPFAIDIFSHGTYRVLATVDPERVILDMDRTNNVYKGPKIEIGPDLAISKLASMLLPNGEQVEVQDTVVNQGTLPVNHSFKVSFYLSTDERLDDLDRLLGNRIVRSLEVGEESAGKTLLSLPPKTEPAHAFVLGRVDPEGVIGELQLGNNTASSGRLLKTDVDLMIGQLIATLTSQGDRVTLTDTIRNLGPQDIAGPFSITFYLSKDGEIDAEDLLLGERRVDGLKAGMTSSSTTTLLIPKEVEAGKPSVLARVDSRNEVLERKEDNNDYWGSSLHLGPDLTLAELKSEVAPDARTIAITQVIRNQGSRATAQGFKTTAFLSSDDRIDSGDYLLGKQPVSPIPAGGVTSVQSSFSIPDSLQNGRYFLLGRVDTDQEVEEIEEGNNDQPAGEIFLGPDLVVEAVRSTLAPEKDRVVIEDVVRNQGNRTASGNIEIAYFLSRNWSIDESDIPLGTRSLNHLKPGESSSVRTTLSIPKKKVPTGRYFVLARVDAGNGVVETDETNNVRPTLAPLVIRQERK